MDKQRHPHRAEEVSRAPEEIISSIWLLPGLKPYSGCDWGKELRYVEHSLDTAKERESNNQKKFAAASVTMLRHGVRKVHATLATLPR